MIRKLLATALVLGVSATAAMAKEVKIGFVTTLTTGAAIIGNDMKKAAELAVADMGGKMAGLDVNLIFADDGFKPETGKQATDKLVNEDNVDFVTGYIWSNVLLASVKSAMDAGKFLISANAGPSQLAGRGCQKDFFNISWQNDQTPQAMGEVLNQLGIKSIYIMSPNYAAGKDMAAGAESTFKGEIKGKDLTKWPSQLDFSAELAKAKASGAEALFAFYPGKPGGAFLKQYVQAGLKDKLKLYTVFTIDALSLPILQKGGIDVLGSRLTQFWDPTLDNAANKKFVSEFKAKYGSYPSFYAAQAYDAMNYIKGAVEAVKGDLSNHDAVRAALQKADFPSVRGEFKMGPNHFPIENFYLREVVADADGNWTTKVVRTVYTMNQDSHAKDCPMK